MGALLSVCLSSPLLLGGGVEGRRNVQADVLLDPQTSANHMAS